MAVGMWWARSMVGPPTNRQLQVRGYGDARHPDGAVVDVAPDAENGENGNEDGVDTTLLVVGRATADGNQVRHLQVTVGRASPRLWWVELPETSADPPAVNLGAFDLEGTAPGTVIDAAAFRELPAQSSDQVGAVRWWPASGQIHQIYVQPTRRREGIGTALLLAAGGYRVLRNWVPLWGSGERTDLGEALTSRGVSVLGARSRPRTHRVPPMTPAHATAGVPQRLLVPDPSPHSPADA